MMTYSRYSQPNLDYLINRVGFPLPDGTAQPNSHLRHIHVFRCAVCRQIGAKLTALGEWFEVRGQVAAAA